MGIGLLIGLERGWSTREARSGSRAAGARIFAIQTAALAGGCLLAGWLVVMVTVARLAR